MRVNQHEQEERDLEQKVVDDLSRQWVRGFLVMFCIGGFLAGWIFGMVYVSESITKFIGQTLAPRIEGDE